MVEKTILTIPILNAFEKEDGCPLCFLWKKDEASYMEYFLMNEVTMNPESRQTVVDAAGFCNRHMHLLYRQAFSGQGGDGLGYGLYAMDIIGKFEERLGGLRSNLQAATKRKTRSTVLRTGRAGRGAVRESAIQLAKVIQGSARCPVCEMLLGSDRRTVSTFLDLLDDDAFAGLFLKSNGICLPHFVSASETLAESRARSEAVASLLIDGELENLRRIGRLLGERVRKYSWDFKDEKVSAAEGRSQESASKLIAGVEGLYCRTRKVGLLAALEEG